MLAKVCSAALTGIEAYPVEVEVNAGWGDTLIVIVGLLSIPGTHRRALGGRQPYVDTNLAAGTTYCSHRRYQQYATHHQPDRSGQRNPSALTAILKTYENDPFDFLSESLAPIAVAATECHLVVVGHPGDCTDLPTGVGGG